MEQHYGVLRVVRVRPPVNRTTEGQQRYPTGWLPEERLVHLITCRQTSIGRALSNDIILLDPTVSREHARLVLGDDGWHIINLTLHNVVRVNGKQVHSGGNLPLKPQDVLVLGSTMLQLIAPQVATAPPKVVSGSQDEVTQQRFFVQNNVPRTINEWQRLQSSNGQMKLQFGIPASVPLSRMSLPPSSLPVQPEPEYRAQPWDEPEERVLGAGITMQFALPQRMGLRTRWLIIGAAIAILFVSAVVTLVLNRFIGLSALAQNGPSGLLTALIIPLIPALGINLLINFIDRFEREPWFLRLGAFLWGAMIAIPAALLIEQNVEAVMQNALRQDANMLVRSLLQGLNAGITEETVKGLGLLLLFIVLRDQFDNVTDGIVYGALIGAGFAMVENFVYFALNSKNFLVFLIVGRIMLGWLCHSTFTVCFGAALGYIRHTRSRWRHIVVPLAGYLCAVGLHTVFDFIAFYASASVLASPGNASVAVFSLLAIIGDYIPPFLAQIALIYVLIKALTHEAAVIREFLADEVSRGVVRVDEYALLQNSFQRTRTERQVLWRRGVKQWMLVKALYQTEIGLAFRKWHVSMGDKPKLGYRQPEDAYRQRIFRLRQEIMSKV
ncbi:MAG: PrsW family intramembrane metalloprotease [Ktedonobacteraceae bacterium]|nr:PrsW family intramembrane metalloprotease [Ktedonobacteraceae bacterium]